MKKKALSLALALSMCLGLTVPAFANEESPIPTEEGVKNISITAEIGGMSFDDLDVKSNYTLRNWEYNEEKDEAVPADDTLTDYIAVTKNTKFTVKHTGTVDDGTTLRIYVTSYINTGDGIYDWSDWPHDSYLTHTGFIPDFVDPEDSLVELKAGESVTFTLPFSEHNEDGEDVIFQLRAEMYFPQYEWAFWKYYFCKEDEAAYNAAIAKGPSAPDQPVTPAVPDEIPASGTAIASTQTVTVDGKKTEFQMYALKDANGNLTNYIKLRDMAYVLNGTKAQFAVGFDGTISLTAGQAYTAAGGEMTTPYSGDRAYKGGTQSVKVNGSAVDMTAITLTDDAGGAYNYFKLRDLGKALGFNVGFSREQGVYIESDKPYIG